MNPIDQANYEAIDRAYSTALEQLAAEGIDGVFIPDAEETQLFNEVKNRVEADEDPEDVISFIKARFRAHFNRQNINQALNSVFDNFDDDDHEYAYGIAA